MHTLNLCIKCSREAICITMIKKLELSFSSRTHIGHERLCNNLKSFGPISTMIDISENKISL